MPTEVTPKEKFTNKAFVSTWNSSIRMICLLILVISVVALFMHFLDSPSFAAIISTLIAAYHYHDATVKGIAMRVQQSLMNPNPPGPGA